MSSRFQLFLDTSGLTFTAAGEASPKLDEMGNQRMDRETKLPLFAVGVVAWFDGGAEVLNVTVAGTKPEVQAGVPVTLPGLRAVPWVRGSQAQVAFRAEAITVDTSSSPGVSPSSIAGGKTSDKAAATAGRS